MNFLEIQSCHLSEIPTNAKENTGTDTGGGLCFDSERVPLPKLILFCGNPLHMFAFLLLLPVA